MRQALMIGLLCLGWTTAAVAHGLAPTDADARNAALELFRALLPSAQAAARVRIDTGAGYRYVTADGMPDHTTGAFPNRNNPNRISAQRYEFRALLDPLMAERLTPLRRNGLFGVAINGVPFDPFTAEFWNNDRQWNYEALGGALNLGVDQSNAHVQPNGAYHYHGIPSGILERFAQSAQPILIGYAADGFAIYGPRGYKNPREPQGPLVELRGSYRVKPGNRPGGPGGKYDGSFIEDYEYVAGLGDLDECNGRSGVMPEYAAGTYYYVITANYPFIPRCFMGTPDESFTKTAPHRPGRPPGPPPGGHDPRRPPPGFPPPGR